MGENEQDGIGDNPYRAILLTENQKIAAFKDGDEIALILDTKDTIIAQKDAEIEKLTNRVNLLSVSANQIRDAYDNGLNAELKARIHTLEDGLEKAVEALELGAEIPTSKVLIEKQCTVCSEIIAWEGSEKPICVVCACEKALTTLNSLIDKK